MEKRDLYNKNKEKTNEVILATEEVPENRYILVELVLIQDTQGRILVQKRSKEKGGEFGLTSGHAKSGESPLQGIITEIKEELGIDVEPHELRLMHSERSDEKRRFYDLFYLQKDYNILDMELQKEEVEEVMWLFKKEVETLCSKKDFKSEHIDAYEMIMQKLKERE